MDELVSVIVPVYNVEEYLPHCLASLASQTYQNLEIILVDDGSTDNSGKLCDEYAMKDLRAKVVHQANKGLWAARNAGQDIATGDYLWFPDGDDYFHKDFVKIMYDAINRTDSNGDKPNMAVADYKETYTFDEDVTTKKKHVYRNYLTKAPLTFLSHVSLGPILVLCGTSCFEGNW